MVRTDLERVYGHKRAVWRAVWAESAQPSPSPEATPQAAQALSNEIALYPNSRELGSLDGEGSSLSYLFTPAMDATFRFMSFDAASGESADLVGELYLEGEGQPLAVSEGGAIRISAQLKADQTVPAGGAPGRGKIGALLPGGHAGQLWPLL